jgi:hypothetical protein
MSSYIRFSGADGDHIKVEEDADAVVDLWRTARGLPFTVTRANGTHAYVNPERIACVVEVAQSAARRTLSGAGPASSSSRIR